MQVPRRGTQLIPGGSIHKVRVCVLDDPIIVEGVVLLFPVLCIPSPSSLVVHFWEGDVGCGIRTVRGREKTEKEREREAEERTEKRC